MTETVCCSQAMDELVGLESEITGKWRRAHRPMKGPVKLRPNGQSLLERTFPGSVGSAEASTAVEAAISSVVLPDGSSALAVEGSAASPPGVQQAKADGLMVQIPPYDDGGSPTGTPTGKVRFSIDVRLFRNCFATDLGLCYAQTGSAPASAASVILGMRKEKSGPASPLEQWAQLRAIDKAKAKLRKLAQKERTRSADRSATSDAEALILAKEIRQARAETMFRQLDSDGSGSLDREELQALARTLGTTLSDREISEAMAEVDKDGDGSVDLSEFLVWYEGNHGAGSPVKGQNNKSKSLLAKLESWSDAMHTLVNEDINMPQNFIWVHIDATARLQTLKGDSSRLDRCDSLSIFDC